MGNMNVGSEGCEKSYGKNVYIYPQCWLFYQTVTTWGLVELYKCIIQSYFPLYLYFIWKNIMLNSVRICNTNRNQMKKRKRICVASKVGQNSTVLYFVCGGVISLNRFMVVTYIPMYLISVHFSRHASIIQTVTNIDIAVFLGI